jgi:hypothetical protein
MVNLVLKDESTTLNVVCKGSIVGCLQQALIRISVQSRVVQSHMPPLISVHISSPQICLSSISMNLLICVAEE